MFEMQKHLEGRIVDRRFPLLKYLGGTDHSCVFLTDFEYVEGKTRKAAIKLIEEVPGHAEAQLIRWRLAAKFDHSHLLRIFHMDRCKLDGASMLYVVMENAEENLADTLLERPLSQEEMHDLFGIILDVLGYLHSKGFVHGHIQPSNIMAIGDQVKLSSDGICRIAEEMEHHNGRTRYSAPECTSAAPTAASDIWSLGATLVDCLAGPLDKLGASNRGKITVSQDLPAPFLEIARHCLVEDPRRRWDVSQLKALLHKKITSAPEVPIPAPIRVQAKQPSTASKKPTVAPKQRSTAPHHPSTTRKNLYPYRVPLTIGGIVVAVLLIGMAFSHRNSNASGPVPPKTESAAVQPISASADSPKARALKPTRANAKEPPKEKPRAAAPPKSEAPRVAAQPKTVAPPVVPTGELVRGDVIHQVMPDVPRSASDTIWGTVRVRIRVNVDPSGNVVAANFDSPGPSHYFARLSMAAARDWKFRSPSVNGTSVPSEWVIHFHYRKTESTASPVEQKP
jgi:serine/threonine protein kinase